MEYDCRVGGRFSVTVCVCVCTLLRIAYQAACVHVFCYVGLQRVLFFQTLQVLCTHVAWYAVGAYVAYIAVNIYIYIYICKLSKTMRGILSRPPNTVPGGITFCGGFLSRKKC